MTGERELPEGKTTETEEAAAAVGAAGGGGGEAAAEEIGWSGGPDWERSGGGAKNPTWRTFGSLTERGFRRGSMKVRERERER